MSVSGVVRGWAFGPSAGGQKPPAGRGDAPAGRESSRALELIAAELEQLRVLEEHELGVFLEYDPEDGRPYVVQVEE